MDRGRERGRDRQNRRRGNHEDERVRAKKGGEIDRTTRKRKKRRKICQQRIDSDTEKNRNPSVFNMVTN